MLVVKVELHSAITGEVQELGRTVIWNDATGTKQLGNYRVAVCGEGSTDYTQPQHAGWVTDYPRLTANIWNLVLRSLLSALPEGERW